MPGALNLLTDVEGVAVGHATDLALGSGVTAIVFDQPAIARAPFWVVLRVDATLPCSIRR